MEDGWRWRDRLELHLWGAFEMGNGNRASRASCLINWCISMAEFYVLVNGTQNNFFQISRGSRQGDLLLPCLFVIDMESFCSLMKVATNGGFLVRKQVKG